ncbi:MAG: hypothetical protein M3071_13330 [Actinomycetota bacterium]|nr:hypothetical protein [Actinomycetota bacterium]
MTATPTPTPNPSQPGHRVRATLLIVSRYSGARTRLIRIRARNLPGNAQVVVRCCGPHCPRPRSRTASATHLRRLWKALIREVFTAGDRVIFTFTAPGLLPERTEILIREDAKPISKRLGS